MNGTRYILGHSDQELRRLELQAAILDPLTKRLLHEAGLSSRMSVLEIGTGAGDLAILAGLAVGPRGRVLGIDRSVEALERARKKAKRAQLDWVEFNEVDFTSETKLGTFDLVVGRYVLMHQTDPIAFLQNAAFHVKHGGVLALLELAQRPHDRYSIPPVAAYDETLDMLLDSFTQVHADLDIGSKLVSLFSQANLSEPALIADTPVGGPQSVLPEWLARTRQNIEHPNRGDEAWRSLMEAIQKDTAAAQSQLFGPRNVAAWVRIVATH